MIEQPQELVSGVSIEKPKSMFDYLTEELGDDIPLFSANIQPIVRKFINGEILPGRERDAFDIERKKWWKNKYGFPFDNKAARTEVLMRKYAKPKAIASAHALQEKLLQAYEKDDKSAIDELKQNYQEEYPNQLEGVEILFGLEQFFNDEVLIDSIEKKDYTEVHEAFRSLTEYSFLLTDFINHNSDDKAFLEKFWGVLAEIAKKKKSLDRFQKLQRSTATQVAVQKIFEQAGIKSRISHPAEDAFHAIDLWTDTAAIQIKGGLAKTVKAGAFIETDTVAFPSIEVTRAEFGAKAKTYHVNSHMFHEAQKFHTKLSRYRQFTNKDVRGYFLVVPYQKVDFITGEPAPELVELVKKNIKTELR